MVDVGAKPPTHRVAVAEAFVRMRPDTVDLLRSGELYKGDALAVARIAGIAGSKRTADLIPLAHPIALTHVAVELTIEFTEPGLQGDRSSGGTKPATLETGLVIQVPLFIDNGEKVKIDTRSGEYLSRA